MKQKTYYTAIDDTPELARALGRFMAYWAHVEFEFSQILAALLRTDNIRARMIYLQFPSNNGKCNLARRLAMTYLEDSKERNQLIELIGDFLNLTNTRNKYAHGTWAPSLEQDDALTIIHGTAPQSYKKPFEDPLEVTLEALEADIQIVFALLQRLDNFLVFVLPLMAVKELPVIAREL